DILVAYGLGQDSDQTPEIVAYEWLAVEEGNRILGTAATLTIPAASLPSGRPLIGLRVRDGEGEWSDVVTVRITVDGASPAVQQLWTMLLYLAGDYDDEDLFNKFSETLDELCKQAAAQTISVRIAALLDGPGNNDSFHVRIDPNAASPCTGATLYEPIAEQAMDAPDTLATFIAWGQQTFPAERYYLSLGNHGQAVLGIAWDATSDRLDDGAPNYSAYLTVKELGEALQAKNTLPVAILHLDACSMNLVETAYELRDRTEFLIASQYLGWDFFAYDDYAGAMTTAAAPDTVATAIVDRYATLAETEGLPYTIAALNMARASITLDAVDALAQELIALLENGRIDRLTLATLWADAAKFESNGDLLNDSLDLYVDLVDWTSSVANAQPGVGIDRFTDKLLDELTGAY
ncbi:MAG: hypothetical protein KDE31_24205, partial [Caldilineaceae bacterium]|nr:hypothetical protein [Caldilineaceae bacterium]